jgi:hypothetical protein
LTALIGKIEKGNLDDFTDVEDNKVVKVPREKLLRVRNNLFKFINEKEKRYPPLRALLRRAYIRGKLLQKSHLNTIVEVEREENENNNDPRGVSPSPSNRGSNTASDPGSSGSAKKGIKLSKGQKKKEARRRKLAFYAKAYNAGGGYTRKLKR